MIEIIEIVKTALNMGLIFLDILNSLTTIYKDLMEQFRSQYTFAEAA
jgi:hypothetical protein